MTTITKSDPRLTAFVLGELSETEAKEIQSALASDADLQAEVSAIRQIADQIQTAMNEEPLPKQSRNRKIASKKRWLIPAAVTAIAALLVVALALPVLFEEKTVILGLVPDEALNKNAKSLTQQESDSQLKEEGYDRFQRTGQIAEWNAEPIDSKKNLTPLDIFDEKAREGKETHALPQSARVGDPKAQEEIDHYESGSEMGDTSTLVVIDLSAPSQASIRSGSSSSSMGMGGMSGMGGGMMGGTGGSSISGGRMGMGMSRPKSGPTGSMRPQSNIRSIPTASAPPMDKLRQAQEIDSRRAVARGDAKDQSEVADFTYGADFESGDKKDNRMGWRDRQDSYNSERNEAYKDFTENDFKPVKLGEFSTFSIDVDTAAYTVMRRYILDMNRRPPADSVRLEEYLNYFQYDYAQPTDSKPFATHVDVFPCPWESKHLLARVGIKGKAYTVDERPPLNLVFLVDVSGSMSPENRLPLVKKGLTDLVEMLQPKDRVAIVTYASGTQVVLPSVSGQEKRAILDSINGLNAGGSTAGASGIKLAYETARKYYDKEAQNRVILCTDGDFNVGTTDNKTLEQMIGDEAKSGVFLTILGFGMGNYKDDRLKTLSMRGNGNYGYIDSFEECQRLLVEGLTGTLFTIAKDVKIQVDFNPAKVSGYRLLGYENRKLRDEDFHNDAVDAGDIGAGHTVTALYEIVPAGERLPTAVDKSRYDTTDDNKEPGTERSAVPGEMSDELMLVKLRYKEPDGDKSSLLEYPVKATVGEANGDSQFASAVALYGMLLRSSRHSGNGTWSTVLELASPNTKDDKYRKEFIDLVKKAKELH